MYYKHNILNDYLDLWTKCLRFEYEHGKLSLVDVIYSAALQILDPDLRSDIIIIKDTIEREYK